MQPAPVNDAEPAARTSDGNRRATSLTSGTPPLELPQPAADYAKRMPRCSEESCLRVVGQDVFGRSTSLAEDAATAWITMQAEAEAQGLHLLLLSGFRSVARQAEIIQRKLLAGQSLDDILRVCAYPGHSEHHTGRAVDIGSPACEHFSEAFAQTREFAWLSAHAARHGFHLSYPRANTNGVIYEPWHWCMVPSKRESR